MEESGWGAALPEENAQPEPVQNLPQEAQETTESTDANELAKIAQELRNAVKLKDRTIRFKKYPLTWKIQEAVDFLTKNKKFSVGDAYNVLQKLLDSDLICGVTSIVESINQTDLYKFTVDDQQKSISVKQLLERTEEIGYSGVVLYKGGVFWSDRFMALNKSEKKIYIFSNEKATRPSAIVDLTLCKILVAECACKTGWYCWTIVDEATKKKHSCCVTQSKDQISWLDNITKCGAQFEEEDINTGGTSIFDFTAKDIDGNEVPLSKYKGKVCIVTNVASF